MVRKSFRVFYFCLLIYLPVWVYLFVSVGRLKTLWHRMQFSLIDRVTTVLISDKGASNAMFSDELNCSKYVGIKRIFGSGLGNHMFVFAAAVQLAELTGRELVLLRNNQTHLMSTVFDLKAKMLNNRCADYSYRQNGLSYDQQLVSLATNASKLSNQTLKIQGYFQSWKHVMAVKQRLLDHYTFKKRIKEVAYEFLRTNTPKGWDSGFVRVGVHVRRGDFLNLKWKGFSVAPKTYFQKAMEYYLERFGRTQFIVVSIDSNWTTRYINMNLLNNGFQVPVNITYSFGHTAAEDMAILSLCNHTIVSSGTFGWWSAWLSGGVTVYYRNFPRPNSVLYRHLNPVDYYPPDWIPMD